MTSGADAPAHRVVPRRRRPAPALHRWHDRHAEGRDVAPGRPVQRARRRAATRLLGTGPAADVEEVAERAASSDAPPMMVVACPLMHGTGQFSALIAMTGGGAVVSLADRHFDVEQLFDTIERRRATNVVIVGQAFAGPMLEHLDAHPGRYDLSSVDRRVVLRRDVEPRQQAGPPAAHAPGRCSSTPSARRRRSASGASVSAAGVAEQTAKFAITENNAVFTDDGRRVEPGSGEMGMVAVGGFIPVGYYKDEAKSAATFRVVDGPALEHPGRLRHGQRRRHDPPPRPRLGVHQHRRREGLPGGGRGGAEDAPERARRGRRRHPRRALRRDDLRRDRACRRRRRRRRPS